MDHSLLHTLNNFLAAHDGVEDPVLFYENIAEILFLALLAAGFLFAPPASRRPARRAVVAAGLSAAGALAIAHFLSQLVDRPRPFVADPGSVHLFAHHVADAGFPSDHATAAFAIAAAILLRDRSWGMPLLALATVLAIGRVAIGVHYPSDVLAGAALGTLTAVGFWQPLVRARIDRLADACGALLDSALAAMSARPRRS